ncbi:hypothetical protein CEXT_641311 [Caerostris extrusa]|uniref:Uncharacterized protein n=1 Tax=Caerostris extrusa TaxID=172846 RepID=A0AAV4Y6H6_CAEEX|nr:hypothetical protein CEXT_641311 [Caerostris extrusa]
MYILTFQWINFIDDYLAAILHRCVRPGVSSIIVPYDYPALRIPLFDSFKIHSLVCKASMCVVTLILVMYPGYCSGDDKKICSSLEIFNCFITEQFSTITARYDRS